MRLKIEIKTDNAAFDYLFTEVALILRKYADDIEHNSGFSLERNLFDSNGNNVGSAMVSQ